MGSRATTGGSLSSGTIPSEPCLGLVVLVRLEHLAGLLLGDGGLHVAHVAGTSENARITGVIWEGGIDLDIHLEIGESVAYRQEKLGWCWRKRGWMHLW